MNNLYTIIGSNKIELDNTLKEIKDKYKNNTYDILTMDLDESSLISFLNEINTIPFLTDFRMVILKSPLFLYDTKNTNYDKRLIDDFKKFINNPLPTTILITIIKSSEKSELIDLLKSKSDVYDITDDSKLDIKEYLRNVFKKDGYTINDITLDSIIKRCEGDKDRVILEAEKLKIYKEEDLNITLEDVNILVNKDLDENIFDLVKEILGKNKMKALTMYHELIFSGVSNLGIISTMISSLLNLYKTKRLIEEGLVKNEVAEILKISAGRAYYLMKDASSYSLDEIKKTIDEMVSLEFDYKTGRNQDNYLLDLYLTRL